MFSLLARRYPLLEMPGAEKGDEYDLAMVGALLGEARICDVARVLGEPAPLPMRLWVPPSPSPPPGRARGKRTVSRPRR